jgi:hypothetical protein
VVAAILLIPACARAWASSSPQSYRWHQAGSACDTAQLTAHAALLLLLLLQTIMRSFLGVGAPEAILVAVVALVVFGPKGLADVS